MKNKTLHKLLLLVLILSLLSGCAALPKLPEATRLPTA